MNVNKIVIFDF